MPAVDLHEQLIGTVDTWQLRELRWPLMRLFARRFVEQHELEHYLDTLLASGRWSGVRAAPRLNPPDTRTHIFDIYGRDA